LSPANGQGTSSFQCCIHVWMIVCARRSLPAGHREAAPGVAELGPTSAVSSIQHSYEITGPLGRFLSIVTHPGQQIPSVRSCGLPPSPRSGGYKYRCPMGGVTINRVALTLPLPRCTSQGLWTTSLALPRWSWSSGVRPSDPSSLPASELTANLKKQS